MTSALHQRAMADAANIGPTMNRAITFSGAGLVLRRRRQERRLTVKNAAKRMGINKSTLSRYENNNLPLSDQIISKAAKALRLRAEDLMYDCLCHLRPQLRNSPFFKLLGDLIGKRPNA